MPDPPPIRLHADPPIDQWRVTPRNGRDRPIIASGHQPTLWHPGIVAKPLAMQAFAQSVGGDTAWVTVDYNALPPLAIDLPTQEGDRLGVRRLVLDTRPQAGQLPPNRLTPLPREALAERLAQAYAAQDLPLCVYLGLKRLAAQGYNPLLTREDASNDLAGQTIGALETLEVLPLDVQQRRTSTLITPEFIDRLLADPVGCVRCYNRAALAYPETGIRPLYLGREVVEAPLWAQDATTPTPVYIDLGDSKRPQLFTTGHNAQLDLAGPDAIQYLRPRAISLSAIMRSEHCDLFIHGTGGGVYDQVTDRWWHDWLGQDLAPSVVVSADVYLPFDTPVATGEELTQAQWLAHHLPHNVDRYTQSADGAEALLRQEKCELLDRMSDDRDKRRRAKAFKRIHAINAELQARHETPLHDAAEQARRAQVGVSNAAIARRRDWCFALYPDASLQALREMVAM